MAATFAAARNSEGNSYQTAVAAAAITAGQALKLHSTEGQVTPTTAITDVICGFAIMTAASGDEVVYQTGGIVKAIAKGAITLGQQLMPSGAGGADIGKVSTAAGATAVSCGIAQQDAADGVTFSARAVINVSGPANA